MIGTDNIPATVIGVIGVDGDQASSVSYRVAPERGVAPATAIVPRRWYPPETLVTVARFGDPCYLVTRNGTLELLMLTEYPQLEDC